MCLIASSLLLVMAVFHGSGINYVTDLIKESNADDLIKNIFPVLFIIPTVQLAGFAILGVIASTLKHQANKILIPLSVLVFADALLAFYLGATLPGVVLLVPAILFLLAALSNSSLQKAPA
ncbi:MAG TPA: hypothetical protein DCE41_02040 [Cytophagales bacterium]|nr:hypothetical protein [Cytophagales bacterium]HAP60241.1 hypothetical protein [Cytophagales bacterium]